MQQTCKSYTGHALEKIKIKSIFLWLRDTCILVESVCPFQEG